MADPYNLFTYAPRELSHSAFWGWVLKCSDPACPIELEEVKQLGLSFLDHVGVQRPKSKVDVETERPLAGGKVRIDIHVTVDDLATVLIENKVSARLDTSKLEDYSIAARAEGLPNPTFVFLSTAFEPRALEQIRSAGNWTCLDLDAVVALLANRRWDNPILSQYANWVEATRDAQLADRKALFSSSEKDRCQALKGPVGQHELMARIITKNKMKGELVCKRNKGGSAFTRFCFCNVGWDPGEFDTLFYRIDRNVNGPYFSLRQYQYPVDNFAEKKARLSWLRDVWDQAVAKSSLRPASVGNRGRLESQVGTFQISDNPPVKLISEVPRIHIEFVRHLEASGWPIQK